MTSAFGVDETRLYQWLNAMGMPAVKANDQYYFNSVEVLEWALKNNIGLTPALLKLCEKGRTGQDIFTPALTRGGVHQGISGTGRDQALEQVLKLLPLPAHIQPALLIEMLLSREQAGTTAIGDGIAIPHVKHPVVLAGIEPVVGLFFLNEPVDFDAFDGVPVHTLFVILSGSFKAHLSLLSRLAFCLQAQQVKELLARRADPRSILAAFQIAESTVTGSG